MTHLDARIVNSPKIPLLDIVGDNQPLLEEMLEAIRGVFAAGCFLHGPDVKRLEEAVAARCGTKHAVACASGSDALLLALLALDIGPGDEVIVPSFTFFATASAVWRVGARIVFADIDPATFNVSAAEVQTLITDRTKAIIPVHLYGRCADMQSLCAIAQPAGIPVIEDAAQAIGAAHQDRPAGGWGGVGCLSFYPTKNLGGCGDGGMLTTDDGGLADRLRLFAAHGMSPRYVHRVVGINSRLDTIQAAALRVKLHYLAHWTHQRQANAFRYHELFADADLERRVTLPLDDARGKHVWNQYTLRVHGGCRDELRAHLASQGIATEVYYPIPLHLQECFGSLGYGRGSLPETERAAAEVLSLPVFPGLTVGQQERVVRGIRDYFTKRRSAAA